jgi:Na+-driven multidrug efflux pump
VAAVAGAQAIAVLFSKSDPTLVELVRDGLPWFTVPIILFCLSGTVAHYFMSTHQPKKAGVLLLGRQLLAIPLFLLLPRCCGFRGIYWASPCAELPFALIAAHWLLEELRTSKRGPATPIGDPWSEAPLETRERSG